MAVWSETLLEPKKNGEDSYIGVAWREVLKTKQIRGHPYFRVTSDEVSESKLGEMAWQWRGKRPRRVRRESTLWRNPKLGFRV